MQDKLFHGLPTALLLYADNPKPVTDPLAHYVLHVLPADLRACVDGSMQLPELAAKQYGLLESQANHIRTLTDSRLAREAQLDLVMLLGGYLLAKAQAYEFAPPLLLELLGVNAQRHNLALRMTYELIVDCNTEAFVRSDGHIRVFSDEPIARIERDFYIGHYFAEQHIRSAYETFKAILERPAEPHKVDRLRTVLIGLQRFTEFMAVYSRLPHAEYAYFRRFLLPYPDKTKNASGAFMPSPQLFEMLLQPPAEVQSRYIATNMPYFSHWAQPLMVSQATYAKEGGTLEAMLESGQLALTAAERLLMADIVEQFIAFKLVHIKVVSGKIPEAFPKPPIVEREALGGACPFINPTRSGHGAQQGTGGFSPQDFLGDGVRRLLELQKRLAL
jgi:hypothetical protein